MSRSRVLYGEHEPVAPAGMNASAGRPAPAPAFPDQSWTVAQIDSWAAERNVEFMPGSTKAEKLAQLPDAADTSL